jgi:hypothetical protein
VLAKVMAIKTNDIIWNESKLAIVASTSACVHDISVGGVSREMKTTTESAARGRGHLQRQTLQQSDRQVIKRKLSRSIDLFYL